MVTVQTMTSPLDSTNISVSAEENQKQLQEVLRENVSLKENLFQTNLAMKQQLSTVQLLQDRASEVQKKHQSKFEETKALILKLNSEKTQLQETSSLVNTELNKVVNENKDLKEANITFSAEASKILSENDSLKKQVSTLQETMQTMAENGRKASLQPSTKEAELRDLVDQLARKLEGVERARRQQDFDIDRLQAQLGRASHELNEAQRKLALAESALQEEKEKPVPVKEKPMTVEEKKEQENFIPSGDKFIKYDEILTQLKASVHEEKTRSDSLRDWLTMTNPNGTSSQIEIAELRHLLVEEQTQSVARKENLLRAVSMFHDLLYDFKKLGEDLERLKADQTVKESHAQMYEEMRKKAFRVQLDEQTAKLVETEEKLAIAERHLASLNEALRLQNSENKEEGELKHLKEQLDALKGEVASKDELVEAKNKALNALKEEIESRKRNEEQELQLSKETCTLLEEQLKIYQADFLEERKSRESLATEKSQIMEEHQQTLRRNQELVDQLSKIPREYLTPPSANENPNPRAQEAIPLDPPQNTVVNTEIKSWGVIFHEKQQGQLCAQHCVNTLLQGAYFHAVDLAELAQEMDFAEKLKFAEAGIDSSEYRSFIKKPSENMDDTGYFSVQVISCALQLWDLELIPYNSSVSETITIKNNSSEAKAFICNSQSHWFTIRRLGNRWFNLNSTLDKPEPISDLYLDFYLEQLLKEKKSLFIVLGDLPYCPADNEEFSMKPLDESMLIRNKVEDSFANGQPSTPKKNLKFSPRNFSPLFVIGQRIGRYIASYQR